MEVKLEMQVSKYNATYGFYKDWQETDYTGRWKIVQKDNDSKLFIETFELYEGTKEVFNKIHHEARVKTIQCLFLKWQENIPAWTEKVLETKLIIKVRHSWVSEDDLRIVTSSINQCGGKYE